MEKNPLYWYSKYSETVWIYQTTGDYFVPICFSKHEYYYTYNNSGLCTVAFCSLKMSCLVKLSTALHMSFSGKCTVVFFIFASVKMSTALHKTGSGKCTVAFFCILLCKIKYCATYDRQCKMFTVPFFLHLFLVTPQN
jgi:hypothetical protein